MKVIVVVWLAKIWQTENNSHNKKKKTKGNNKWFNSTCPQKES